MTGSRKIFLLFVFLLVMIVFSFSSSPERIEISTDIRYSSIVLSEDSVENIELELFNNDSMDKNLTLGFSGVRTSFIDGDESKTFILPGDSDRSFAANIDPENAGSKELNIVAQNNDLNINTTEKITVEVLESRAQGSRDVPGINLIHLIFLFTASTVLYFEVL